MLVYLNIDYNIFCMSYRSFLAYERYMYYVRFINYNSLNNKIYNKNSIIFFCLLYKIVTAVGFEPTPFRTGA